MAHLVEFKKLHLSSLVDMIAETLEKQKKTTQTHQQKQTEKGLNLIKEKLEELHVQNLVSMNEGEVDEHSSTILKQFEDILSNSKIEEKQKQNLIASARGLFTKVTPVDQFYLSMEQVSKGEWKPSVPAEITSLGNMSHKQILERHLAARDIINKVKKQQQNTGTARLHHSFLD